MKCTKSEVSTRVIKNYTKSGRPNWGLGFTKNPIPDSPQFTWKKICICCLKEEQWKNKRCKACQNP